MPKNRTLVSGPAAILARRYAGAFYELAQDEKNLDTVAADLRHLLQAIDGNPEFHAVAANPRLTRTQLVKAAMAISSTLKLAKVTGQFVALIAKNRRLSLLPAIIDAFLMKLAADRGERTATVRAASALTAQQVEQISARLAAMAGGKVHVNVHEDKSLIGGLTVQMGSRLIDASIKTKLERLERKLKSQAA